MGLAETPTDELSGLPLLLEPDERILPIVWGFEPTRDANGKLVADKNHPWHPAKEVLESGECGDGLRNSRVQTVLREEQHDLYHDYYYGPPIPKTPAQRFRAMVLCAARYIPPRGIRFTSAGPEIVNFTPWQMTRLRESGEVDVASLSVVQTSMKDFVMAQSVDHIDPDLIDTFLKIDPAESSYAGFEHAYLAHELLSLVIERVEDPLIKPYAYARQRGLLAPDVPETPDQFIVSNIMRNHKNVRAVAREFVQRLTAFRDGAEAAAQLGAAALTLA